MKAAPRKLARLLVIGALSSPAGALAEEAKEGEAPPEPQKAPLTSITSTIDPAVLRILPVNAPDQRGGYARSFEATAPLLPFVEADLYGASFHGASSPENTFIVDGLRIGDPTLGVLLLPLSLEFAERVDITAAAADPALGRGTGGFFDVKTKSGGDRWAVSTWSSFSPGALEGERAPVGFPLTSVRTKGRLDSTRDLGIFAGGPLIRQKLFVSAGFGLSKRRYRLERDTYILNFAQEQDPFGGVVAVPDLDYETGVQRGTPIPGAARTFFAEGHVGQWLTKLTYRPSADGEVSLTVIGAHAGSGGDGSYSIDPERDTFALTNLNGQYSALARQETVLTNAVVLHGEQRFAEGRGKVDISLGWLLTDKDDAAADGSGVEDIGTAGKLANLPRVAFQGLHSIDKFEDVPNAPFICNVDRCPAGLYVGGGPGLLASRVTNRIQGVVVVSYRAGEEGRHLLRAGLDFEGGFLAVDKGFSGAARFREEPFGFVISETRFGFREKNKPPVTLPSVSLSGSSLSGGVFIADTWRAFDGFVVEGSIRYDAQALRGSEGGSSLDLPNQISPRAALAWDPTKKGRAWLVASYSYHAQPVLLNITEGGLSAEPQWRVFHSAQDCQMTPPSKVGCSGPGTGDSLAGGFGRVDLDTKAPGANQVNLGAEVLLPFGVWLSAAYLRDDLARAIEDIGTLADGMSVIGNPGLRQGPAPATRTYDGLSITLTRSFSNGFLAFASYTASWLRGNYVGYFRPETGQLDPNLTLEFDSLDDNAYQSGDLPGDTRQSLKLYGGKVFRLPRHLVLETGLGYTGRSGSPYGARGANSTLGQGETLILPRGAVGTTPSVHRIDARIGLGLDLRSDLRISASLEVFNVANSQTPTAVDEIFTLAEVQPVLGGTAQDLPTKENSGRVVREDGVPLSAEERSPHYAKPTAYQAPRQVRFGLRVDY